jgi:hypothetical protein
LILAILAVLRLLDQCQSKAIKMMIGIGTPNSHNRIARPICSSLVSAQTRAHSSGEHILCILRSSERTHAYDRQVDFAAANESGDHSAILFLDRRSRGG